MGKDLKATGEAIKNKTYKSKNLKYVDFIIELPYYHGYFGIAITNNKNKLKEKFGIESEKIYGHSYLCEYKKLQCFLIVLNPFREKIKITNGVISHEAVHIANFIYLERDIKPDLDNDESYAYLIEFIVNHVYKFLDKLNIKTHLKKR